MATSKRGGRPRNSWNSSRSRKLVRLYTLTTLSKDEIQQVLKAHDFNPSSSDIQKKLRDLLPRDYAKGYSQYQPTDRSLITVRLKRLQQHRQTRKSRVVRTAKDDQGHCTAHAGNTALNPSRTFEGPLSAFRNYAGAYDTSTSRPQLTLSAPPSESQLVVPSLLLLDGTSISGTACNPHAELKCDGTQSSATVAYQSSTNRSSSTPSSAQSHPVTRQSSMISLRSLEARLPHRSSSVIRQTLSALRYSSTDSWRSSTSWRSSWLSFKSQVSTKSAILSAVPPDGHPAPLGAAKNSFPPEGKTGQLPTRLLTSSQRQVPRNLKLIWNELVDEKLLDIRVPPRISVVYGMASYFSGCNCHIRPKKELSLCKHCGMRHVHLISQSLKGVNKLKTLPLQQMNDKDYFDNGPLHFAARVSNREPDTFIKLIDIGADFRSVNTSGATFLHVLFGSLELKQLPEFFPLLRHLATIDYSFSSRDYCGRQPFHMLLLGVDHLGLDSLAKLEEAFAIATPDVDALDNAGRCIRSLFSNLSGKSKTEARADEILSGCSTSKNIAVDFKVKVSEMHWTTWIEWLPIDDRSTWVDSNGDTALTALLKYWRYDQDERLLDSYIKEMVDLGAQIHMRDRNGETALAVAAQRGLRLAVKTLIELGASIHTTNYRGTSILSNARKTMRRAKETGNDKLHAMIWSCIIYLVDLKACEFPSVRRQNWAAWAPDSHFSWGEGKEETVEKVIQILGEEGFVQGTLI